MYLEESFDTIFNMGYGGGRRTASLPLGYGSEKSLIDERVNNADYRLQLKNIYPTFEKLQNRLQHIIKWLLGS